MISHGLNQPASGITQGLNDSAAFLAEGTIELWIHSIGDTEHVLPVAGIAARGAARRSVASSVALARGISTQSSVSRSVTASPAAGGGAAALGGTHGASGNVEQGGTAGGVISTESDAD